MRRILIILVSVTVNLYFNASGIYAFVIAKAGAVSGSGFNSKVPGSNEKSYTGVAAHSVAQASAVAGSGLNFRLSTGGHPTADSEGGSAQSITKAGASVAQYDDGNIISATGHCSICTLHQPSLPGPYGSIHDYKPAVSVSTFSGGSAASAVSHASANAESFYQHSAPSVVVNLPGAPGSIYNSKPVTTSQSVSQSSANTGHVSSVQTGIHVSPSLIASFPGSPGSIYDSKPVTAVAGASASSPSSGSIYHQPHPQPAAAPPSVPALALPNPQLAQIIPVFPGQSGSIHSSKPVLSGSQNENKGIVSGSQHHDESGSITNIPDHVKSDSSCRYVPGNVGGKCGTNTNQINMEYSGNANVEISSTIHHAAGASSSFGSNYNHVAQLHSQPAAVQPVVPASNPVLPNPQLPQIIPLFPGDSGSIHSSKPVLSGSQHVKETGLKNSEYHDESGSITKIPDNVKSGSSCRYVPGIVASNCDRVNNQINVVDHSANANVGNGATTYYTGLTGAAGASSSSSGSNYHVAQVRPQPAAIHQPIVSAPAQIIPLFPSESDSKPVLVGPQYDAKKTASHATSSNYHDESGSITNIPAHLKSGSSCRYVPGSGGSNCGSSDQNNGAGVYVPFVHPEIPSFAGTYYINKPSDDLEAPSFSGQIPCAGSSCGPINPGLDHDAAHLSGGIVFQNEDGSYHGVDTTPKPATYKNAGNGEYAVNSNDEDNKGVLIGPGTGHLPIDKTLNSKPFGTQGAFGGSAAFSSNNNNNNNNEQYISDEKKSLTTKKFPSNQEQPFGSQGAFGGSVAFSKSNEAAAVSTDRKHPLSSHQQLGTQVQDGSTSISGHGSFGVSNVGSGAAAFANSDEVQLSAAAGHNQPLIDLRDHEVHGLSGSFSKSSSSAHSYSSASASAVSYSGSF